MEFTLNERQREIIEAIRNSNETELAFLIQNALESNENLENEIDELLKKIRTLDLQKHKLQQFILEENFQKDRFERYPETRQDFEAWSFPILQNKKLAEIGISKEEQLAFLRIKEVSQLPEEEKSNE